MTSDAKTFAVAGIFLIPFFLPILFLCMLPSLILGGYSSPDENILTNMEGIVLNLEKAETIVLNVLEERHQEVLTEIEKEMVHLNPDDTFHISDDFTDTFSFDAVSLVSQFCASESDYSEINLTKLEQLLYRNSDNIFSYHVDISYHEMSPDTYPDTPKSVAHYEYVVEYSGNSYFMEKVFHLDEGQKTLALAYAENLRLFLMDNSFNIIINPELVPGETGNTAVELALTKLGTPYSQIHRNEENYFDCSSFTYWVYQNLGINLSYHGTNTAAAQGNYIVENNLVVSMNDLHPGDLIFYSFETNDRYLNISHVAIYCGNGYVVEASSVKGKVVYQPLSGKNSIVLCGRPYIN